MNNTRTDLAMEFTKDFKTTKVDQHIKKTTIVVDKQLSSKIGRGEGTYVTVESDVVITSRSDLYVSVSECLGKAIKKMVGEKKKILVVGLGNPNITADSLGKFVTENLLITRHISGESVKVSSLTPNVLGVTGIESFDIIKGVVDVTSPDCVIAVDSLAGAAASRLATAFQVSSAGITPGSGVSNHRQTLDQSSLKVPVISLGVPMVVYASTLISEGTDAKEIDDKIGNMIVTPKDIDVYAADCGKILAGAINFAFWGQCN